MYRWQVVEHYVSRVRGNMELMEQLDVIGRTSELARLFGIQFYEVFTRGSQVGTFANLIESITLTYIFNS